MPSSVAPSYRYTVPVGALPATVTTNGTAMPATTVVAGTASATEGSIAAGYTVCPRPDDTEPRLPPSPAYSAVNACTPVESPQSASRATPPAMTASPTATPPSRNTTVPEGVDPFTVATNSAGVPAREVAGPESCVVVADFTATTRCASAPDVLAGLMGFASPE